jgi:SRSO17 transposase
VPLEGRGVLPGPTKGLCGLDEHQVRCWRSWYRWVTLSMLAYAFLAVVARAERDQHPRHQA